MNILLDWLSKHFEILIGWVLGIASPLFLFVMSRYLSKRSFVAGLKTEVEMIRSDLVSIIWAITLSKGKLEKGFVLWLKPYAKYIREDTQNKDIANALELFLRMDELQLADLNRSSVDEAGGRYSYRRIHGVYLFANVGMIPSLKKKKRELALLIMNQVNVYNENVAEHATYRLMSYGKFEKEKELNLQKSYDALDDQLMLTMKYLVEHSTKYLE